ncbi:YbfB/YjiJ family MFS transporter [Pseudomonas sp. OIL-1]|uniref:YbfB/YjiJ family MFS transporter n=1 Tax=Pseudomonas sp. OIL-1 TaxID=2706126 RepID=UPI0013A7B399|nr:YbfB/YjiJ family MFS transporter [Pseudomonas sp. OIL-1]QIB51652.1 YbfB/YjiJ family MFS transporter [Pseudomonas sp. OIL-1]
MSSSSVLCATRSVDRTRVLLAGVCALILTVGLARFAYTPLLPVMRDGAGLSDLAGGWLATFNYMGYMAGALLAATTNDLQRKFLFYRAGLLIAVFSTAAMGLTDNLYLWATFRFIAGVSSAGGLLIASGLVLNWLINHGHKPELGLHFAGLGAGIVVSGLAVSAMVGTLAWDSQWIGLGLLGILFFLPAWFWLPAPVPVRSTEGTTEQPPSAPSSTWMWLFIAAYFCAGVGFVISATFIVAIVEQLPVFAGNGPWVWVVVGLAAAPASFLWDRVAGLVGGLTALLVAYGLQILSILLPAISSGAFANLLSAGLFGITFVGIVSLTLSIIGRHFPANPSKAMARLTLSYGVAQVIAPAMAGYIAMISGSYRGALFIAAGIMAVGMLLLLLIMRQERRELTSAC